MSRPHPLDWPNALHPRRSPCRIDATKGTRQHPCSTAHADMVEGYRSWRDGEYALAEQTEAGTAHSPRDEPGTYWETRTRPTFGTYLREMSQR